jgi:hypothetical protein
VPHFIFRSSLIRRVLSSSFNKAQVQPLCATFLLRSFLFLLQCTLAAVLVCRPHHHVRWQSYRFCSTSVPEELSLQASDGKHE